jgi:hypothetical protein
MGLKNLPSATIQRHNSAVINDYYNPHPANRKAK